MKQLTCEMCGSTDLIKQDGVFVCQACGTKYSIEEAKKIMVEGTVDVSGSTVKVDNTALISNYLKMAHNAYSSGNNKEAEEYCNKVIEIAPQNAEAWLLKGISAAWQSTLGNLRMEEFMSSAENALSNANSEDELNRLADSAYKEFYKLVLAINKLKLDSVVSLPENWPEYIPFSSNYTRWSTMLQVYYGAAQKKYNDEKPDKSNSTPRTLSTDLGLDDLDLKCKSEVVDAGIRLWDASLKDYNSSRDGYPSDYQFERMIKNGAIAMLVLADVIPLDTSKLSEESDGKKKIIIKACKNLITMNSTWMDLKSYTVSFSGGIKSHPVSKAFNMTAKQKITADIRKYHDIIKICDPSYTVPVVSEPKPTTSGGCYVATAVYGSYDCPEVWTLRRFRDNILAETWYGRAFIHTYYAISPTLVKWFGKSAWFKSLWKPRLDKLVAQLKEEGVDDTPYDDRVW